ncbi:MAG TPA: sugar ABC transporter substrate-binding protein [Firmicutes bacterium]|nr:sugar ABC transporter substrate-binding protein [Bacillota bacterium]
MKMKRSIHLTAFLLMTLVISLVMGSAAAVAGQAVVEVSVVSWFPTNPGSYLDNLKKAFEEANPGYKIVYQTFDSNTYYDRLQVMLVGEVIPDVAMLGFDWIATMAENGMAMNIDQLVREEFPYQEMFPSIQRSLQWKGQFYALCRDITAKTFFYNKAHFAEAGLADPAETWTWNDFVNIGKKLQKGTGDNTERWAFYTTFVRDGYYHWFPTNGADWFNYDRTEVTMTDSRTVETFQFLHDLIYRDGLAPTPAQAGKLRSPFENGIASMQVGGSVPPSATTYPNLEWEATLLPRKLQAGSRVWSNLWFIPAKTANKEAAWKVLSFFAGPEGQRIAAMDNRVPAIYSVVRELNLHPYIVKAFEVGIPFPVIANRDVWNVFDSLLPKLWANEQPVSNILAEIQRQTAPMMRN